MTKLGYCISPTYPQATAEFGVHIAEQMGADSIWVIDHLMGTFHPEIWPDIGFATPGSDADAFLDPFCLMAALGSTTEIPFASGVTDTTRRGAADLVRTALTLQHMCRGGFILGVGSGEAENLVPFGYPYDRPVARCEQVLSELRQLLDTGRFPGSCGRTGLPLENDTGRPEVWLAGHGPRMLRLTGQYADGWFPAFVKSPADYAEKRAVVARHAEAAGRPMPTASFQPFTVLGESLERLEEQFEAEPLGKLFGLFLPGDHWAAHGLEHPLGDQCGGFVDVIVHELDPAMLRELAPTIPFQLLSNALFMGSAREIAEQLDPYVDAGANYIVLANMTGIVGGLDEIGARMNDFASLASAVREL